LTKSLAVLVLSAAVAVSAAASTATASPRMLKGIFDEANTLYGNPDTTFPILGQLGTKAMRVNLYWGGRFGGAAARGPPAAPLNPNDPAYDWGIYDRTVLYASQYGIQVVFSIVATPGWANGGKATNVAPTNALDLQRFATAAARRYGGSFVNEEGRVLPRVVHWLAWNEPNNPVFLSPQYARVGGRSVMQGAKNYARICNAVVTGVKAARVTPQKIACGVTAPRGNNNASVPRSSVSPLAFMRGMKTFGAKGFDAYAHHPYYGRPTETPSTRPPASTAITLGNIDLLIRELTRLWGNKPLWITEYGYQTKPQDKIFGVTYAQQAAYLTQAFAIARKHPRIDMMLWFLLKDDTRAAGWQSGLMAANGAKKPSFVAFQRVK
jgi:hypothetical protein